jgi:precorrin-6B methylase 1
MKGSRGDALGVGRRSIRKCVSQCCWTFRPSATSRRNQSPSISSAQLAAARTRCALLLASSAEANRKTPQP